MSFFGKLSRFFPRAAKQTSSAYKTARGSGSHQLSITPEFAQVLDGLKFDENAKRMYEYLSGGFLWSDEMPHDSPHESATTLIKALTAYRASLILNEERSEFKGLWDEARGRFPNWPGFRPERFSPSLAGDLRRENSALLAEVDYAERVLKRAERIA